MAHLGCQTLSPAEASKQSQVTAAQNKIKASLKNVEHILKERKDARAKGTQKVLGNFTQREWEGNDKRRQLKSLKMISSLALLREFMNDGNLTSAKRGSEKMQNNIVTQRSF